MWAVASSRASPIRASPYGPVPLRLCVCTEYFSNTPINAGTIVIPHVTVCVTHSGAFCYYCDRYRPAAALLRTQQFYVHFCIYFELSDW